MFIKLKSLKLSNFKGIKDLKIDFGKETTVYGANEAGKSTIFDAFNWLLFDKNSLDKSTFSIKTLDSNNQVIHGLEHSVEGVLEVDSVEVKLKKTYKEKWTKPRGQADKLLTGHETIYSIDDTPLKKNVYVDYIKNLIDEDVFKLITNTLHFNENLKWTDRRDLLIELTGEVSTQEVIESNESIQKLKDLLKDDDVDKFKSLVKSNIKKLNDEIKTIPIRLDEINNSLPEVQNIDFENIKSQLSQKEEELIKIEKSINDNSEVYKELSKVKELLYDKQSQLKLLEYQAELDKDKPLLNLKSKLDSLKSKEKNLLETIEHNTSWKEENAKSLSSLNKEIVELRTKWHNINQEEIVFDEKEFICPSCNRALEEVDIEETKKDMEIRFNKNKAKKLLDITNEGKFLNEKLLKYEVEIAQKDNKINETNKELEVIQKEIQNIENEISNFKFKSQIETKEQIDLKNEIEVLKKQVETTEIDAIIENLREEKSNINTEIEELKAKLLLLEQYNKANERRKELLERETQLAQEIAELEGQEYMCEEFIRTKVNMIEEKINSIFKNVKFKLFNILVNGGLEECCETLVDGVPYQDANTGSQTVAGLDIINALSEHFKVTAPIFIDNRESINKLIETKAQIINLYALPLNTKEQKEKFKADKLVKEYQGAKEKLYVEIMEV